MRHFINSILLNRYLLTGFILAICQTGHTQELQLVGIGSYNEFNNTTMVVKIEAALNDSDPAQIRDRFSFRIVEERPVRRWYQFWSQSLSLNNSVASLTNHIDDLLLMNEVLQGPLEPGDLVEFERRGNDSMSMRLNSVALTDFQNSDFYDFLLTAFTGRVPPSSTLKQQLLGEDTDIGTSTALFNSLNYDSPREQVIWGWVDALEAEAEAETTIAQTTPAASEDPEPLSPADSAATAEQPATTETAAASADPAAIETAAEVAIAAAAPITAEPALDQSESVQAEQEQQPTSAEDIRQLALESLVATQMHLRSVRNKVNANMQYPRIAIRRNQEGTVRVALMLNRDGSISSVELVEDSRYEALNQAAIAGVQAAAPFDPIPDVVEGDQTLAEFPISFSLN